MKTKSWLFEKENSLRILVKVKTQAFKNEVKGIKDNRLEITIRAVREKGKANLALIDLLSDLFRIPKTFIKIIRGESSPLKEIAIYNTPLSAILTIIQNQGSYL